MFNKSTICLWFNGQAEEAVNFYTSLFKDGKIIDKFYSKELPPGVDKSQPLTINFELHGQAYMALNGGPQYQFTPAISIMVGCKDQAEIDYYWDGLSAGGQEVACGWLTDKYGLSWQIVPLQFYDLITSKEPGKSERVMNAMMKMVKLDLATLEQA